jgi:hypothetical protein
MYIVKKNGYEVKKCSTRLQAIVYVNSKIIDNKYEYKQVNGLTSILIPQTDDIYCIMRG